MNAQAVVSLNKTAIESMLIQTMTVGHPTKTDHRFALKHFKQAAKGLAGMASCAQLAQNDSLSYSSNQVSNLVIRPATKEDCYYHYYHHHTTEPSRTIALDSGDVMICQPLVAMLVEESEFLSSDDVALLSATGVGKNKS